MKKGWSAGKIIGVIAGVIAAVIILWIAFIASMFQLVDFFTQIEEDSIDEYEWSYDYDEDDAEDEDRYDDRGYDDRSDEDDDRSSGNGGNIGDGESYDCENVLREDRP